MLDIKIQKEGTPFIYKYFLLMCILANQMVYMKSLNQSLKGQLQAVIAIQGFQQRKITIILYA